MLPGLSPGWPRRQHHGRRQSKCQPKQRQGGPPAPVQLDPTGATLVAAPPLRSSLSCACASCSLLTASSRSHCVCISCLLKRSFSDTSAGSSSACFWCSAKKSAGDMMLCIARSWLSTRSSRQTSAFKSPLIRCCTLRSSWSCIAPHWLASCCARSWSCSARSARWRSCSARICSRCRFSWAWWSSHSSVAARHRNSLVSFSAPRRAPSASSRCRPRPARAPRASSTSACSRRTASCACWHWLAEALALASASALAVSSWPWMLATWRRRSSRSSLERSSSLYRAVSFSPTSSWRIFSCSSRSFASASLSDARIRSDDFFCNSSRVFLSCSSISLIFCSLVANWLCNSSFSWSSFRTLVLAISVCRTAISRTWPRTSCNICWLMCSEWLASGCGRGNCSFEALRPPGIGGGGAGAPGKAGEVPAGSEAFGGPRRVLCCAGGGTMDAQGAGAVGAIIGMALVDMALAEREAAPLTGMMKAVCGAPVLLRPAEAERAAAGARSCAGVGAVISGLPPGVPGPCGGPWWMCVGTFGVIITGVAAPEFAPVTIGS
mmetsp:Transcript_8412/g.24039  ORF Transcript_8412/g.24039 Transcript_8412/m.24039 type:complete len:550 (-) Transcript_8412:356-2005(-)